MGTALVAAKVAHFWPPPFSVSGLKELGLDVLVASGADAAYALVVGLTGGLLLRVTRRKPALQRVVGFSLISFCALSVFYGLLSVRIFEVLRSPLTYPLLYLGGDLKSLRSSIRAFVSGWYIFGLLGVPALYGSVVLLCNRFVRAPHRAWFRWAQVAGIAIIALWAHQAWVQFNGEWGEVHLDQSDERIAANPHYVLAASSFAELLGHASVKMKADFPPEYLADFQPMSERPGEVRPSPDIPRGPTNVIVIVCESISTQFLSLYGSKFKTWPRLEAEAAHSLVFNNYYSHVTDTANSLVTLTLSQYPPLTWREATAEHPQRPGTAVAEVLKARAYRKAFITAQYNEWAHQDVFLKDRGYDVVWDAKDSGCPELSSWAVEDRCMVDMILKFIDTDRSAPFFVFSWTQETHHPYEPATTWQEVDFLNGDRTYGGMSWDLGRYLNAVLETDRQLGRLLDGLRERGLADDTLVIITGDHGEAFGIPHKNYGHSGKVYQEDVQVPFLIWNPKLYSGQTSGAIGGHVDLNPTLLDSLGIAPPSSWQGRSLLDRSRPQRAYFYGAIHDYLFGVREGNYKYIFNATAGREELYDLSLDGQEQTNIAPQHPVISRQLRQRVSAWLHYQRRTFPDRK